MDLQLLNYCEFYYQLNGFKKIEVPWAVKKEVSDLTKPDERKTDLLDGLALVGSAEQSFLELIVNGQLGEGRFLATTPCFRDEPVFDEYHKRYFMKTELIDTNNVDIKSLREICEIAISFFDQFVEVELIETGEEMFDIVDKRFGVELGSYGIRRREYVGKEIEWVYATGCAVPRLSSVIDKTKESGYHIEKAIPKNKVGTILKVFEEVYELQDAVLQKKNLLVLCELADLYGSIELYLENNFENIQMDDLKDMSRLTAKAFKAGLR